MFLHPAGLPPASSLEGFDLPADGLDLEAYLEWLGKRLMQQALERNGGVQIRAAELLRMSERPSAQRVRASSSPRARRSPWKSL